MSHPRTLSFRSSPRDDVDDAPAALAPSPQRAAPIACGPRDPAPPGHEHLFRRDSAGQLCWSLVKAEDYDYYRGLPADQFAVAKSQPPKPKAAPAPAGPPSPQAELDPKIAAMSDADVRQALRRFAAAEAEAQRGYYTGYSSPPAPAATAPHSEAQVGRALALAAGRRIQATSKQPQPRTDEPTREEKIKAYVFCQAMGLIH